MVAEIIREQVLVETSEEVPYATTVVIEQFEEGAKLTRIAAAIFCERDGQKGILVGKQARCSRKSVLPHGCRSKRWSVIEYFWSCS